MGQTNSSEISRQLKYEVEDAWANVPRVFHLDDFDFDWKLIPYMWEKKMVMILCIPIKSIYCTTTMVRVLCSDIGPESSRAKLSAVAWNRKVLREYIVLHSCLL